MWDDFEMLLELLLELLKIYIIFCHGFHMKMRKRRYVLAVDLIATAAMSYLIVWGQQWINPMVPYLFFVLITSWVTYRETWYRIIGLTCWTVVTLGLIDGINSTIVQIIFGTFGVMHAAMEGVCASIVTILFLSVSVWMLNRRNAQGLRGMPVRYFVFFSAMVFLQQISLSLVWEKFAREEISLYFVFLFLAIGVLVQMILVLLLACDNYLYQEHLVLNQKFLAAQEQHYQYLEKKEEDTKRFRHDMRDHMRTIGQMAEQGKGEEIVRYMERIFQILEKKNESIVVGNGVVDAILNQFIERCSGKGIQLRVRGHLPADCFVEPFDLCTIFFNILQNAEEAAEQCGEGNRNIEVHIRYEQQMIMIKEENTCCHTLNIQGGSLVTTKEDAKGHGYGIQNVIQSVRRYSGKFSYEQSKGKFRLRIILYDQKNKPSTTEINH